MKSKCGEIRNDYYDNEELKVNVLHNKRLGALMHIVVAIARLVLFVYCVSGVVGAVEHRSILGAIVASVLAIYYAYGLRKDWTHIQENYGKEKSNNISMKK